MPFVPTDPPTPEEFLAVIGIALYVIAALLLMVPMGKPDCAECRTWKFGPKPPKDDVTPDPPDED